MSAALLILLGFCEGVIQITRGEEAIGSVVVDSASALDFNRDIQSILASKCVQCHGPGDAESGLRLDSREHATNELESGLRAITPGKPDESELLRRVTAEEDERMPPEGTPLSVGEVAAIERWIAAGADWPTHWAYRPLVSKEPPTFDEAAQESWIRTPIDRFVLRGLMENGLRPAAPADRRTLLRRIYFDLIGLPPTPQEVATFLRDDSPDAYERLVDRLLASPRYGERWARHWMDVVHYADSHGFEHDLPRPIWPYRDYLVNALNNDKPYAQFVREQVAGDAIAPGNAEALTATGFLATGPWDLSALQSGNMNSIDYRVAQYLDRDDIVSTVMSTFVSSTVHCARCHNHKFDPIAQADYYALQAVMAGIDKAPRLYDEDPGIAARRKALLARQAELQRWRDSQPEALLTSALQAEVVTWESKQRLQKNEWRLLEPDQFRSENGSKLVELDDYSLLSTGSRPEKDTYTITAKTELQSIAALRLEIMADSRLPHGGPGRQDNGNMHLTEITMTVAPGDDPSSPRVISLVRPRADFNQMPAWSVADALDHVQETGWGIYPEVGVSHCAVFELAEPILNTGAVSLTIKLHQEMGQGHLIGRFRLAVSEETPSASLDASTFPTAVVSALSVDPSERSDEQRSQLAAFYLESQIDEQLATLPEQQTVYCGTNQFEASGGLQPALKPRPIHILERGEISTPGPLVDAGALHCLPELSGDLHVANKADEAERRVALAEWLVDSRNVLTWRSIVNRIWQFHFGRGLVTTPNDFGRMGAPPSHPELLDWLALSFRDQGGRFKALHRMMVTSSVYRQSSEYSEVAAARDASNKYLWRMNARRLDAESLRDAILQISGQLNLRMGGSPDKQFLETNTLNMRPEADYKNFDVDDPANHRRSLYRFILRTMPDPLMTALDCPAGNQLTPVRSSSITALQALALVNDKFIIRQSEHIAARLATEFRTVPEQVVGLFKLVLNRAPRGDELHRVQDYVQSYGLANASRFLLNTNEFAFLD